MKDDRSGFRRVWPAFLAVACLLTGCHSRAWYFRRANEDAHCLIQEKAAGKPWAVPAGYSLIPSPESRLAQVDCLTSPRLPCPTPTLYAYEIPELRSELLGEPANDSEDASEEEGESKDSEEPKGVPIPPEAWETLPTQCLQRMLEFESVQFEAEYTKQNYQEFGLARNDSSDQPKLTLEDVIDLALLNSRDYQTQKENLFLVALNLAEERFAFQNRFSNFGNGSALNYTHDRIAGITENRLGIPTGVQGDRLLVTGGDLLASFANNILLTFNGPSGFAADVSSTILVDFAQPLIQRDIRFESLTQAERDVVYAARDFARFRKEFFADFAELYYRLVLSFRQIEIDTQNYFSLVRAFNQAEAEFRREFVPGVQVDQVEQSLLNGRGSLIGTCNNVEQALDNLKLSIGLPTETPINLDLTELNELTRLDRLSVSADSTNRSLRRLQNAMQRPDRAVLASTSAVLIERILQASQLTESQDPQQQRDLDYRRVLFLADEARIASQRFLNDLNQEKKSETPSDVIIFQRSITHAESLIELITVQLQLAALSDQSTELTEYARRQLQLSQEISALVEEYQALFAKEREEDQNLRPISELVVSCDALRARIQSLVREIDTLNKVEVVEDPVADTRRLLQEAESLEGVFEQTINASNFGLKPIDIDVDDAMITALVLRFELMTQRESAADDWRRIKLAADELKSVLDLNARQVIRTESGSNQPFNFTLDDSRTQLGVTFDAPLNRFTQRNDFRASLITYQRALRNLMQLEDTIKFSVRNDLRNLALDREQYLIAVASAALANERVVSTSLEFRLGTGGVSARDFLEAQTAYIEALSNVASRHIAYILDRTQLFLDLELLTVEEDGFWPDLRNEDVQPEPVYGLPSWAMPVYGELPCVKYSHELRDLMNCPPLCKGTLPIQGGSLGSLGTQSGVDDPTRNTDTAAETTDPGGERDGELDLQIEELPVPPMTEGQSIGLEAPKLELPGFDKPAFNSASPPVNRAVPLELQ